MQAKGGADSTVIRRQYDAEYETDAVSLYTQPAFFMAFACTATSFVAHNWADTLMPVKYRGKKIMRLKARFCISTPFLITSGFYVGVCTMIGKNMNLAAHLTGFSVSMLAGTVCMSLGNVSFLWPLFGTAFYAFGGLHHYRTLMVASDNAPLYSWGDFSRILDEMKRRRAVRYHGPAAAQPAASSSEQ